VETEESPEGAQLKVNMLLTRLPRLRDGAADPEAAFAGTFHINEGYQQLQDAYAAAAAGRVPRLPPCEIYCHSLSDRSILGPELAATEAQTLTLFGLHMPARLFREDHDEMRDLALSHTLESLNSVLAEPVQDVLMRDPSGAYCLEARTPVELERDVALPGGNIFHRSLQWPWAERPEEVGTWGVETRHERVLLAGAGARRGGGVSGIPGHNAAAAVLQS
jgi:phytoene dehydrogenase-like protein